MVRRPIDNERKACDAVARSLEDRAGAARSNPRSPEDDKIGSPVEYVFELGSKTYALEHTVVEAFAGQIQTGVDFSAFIAPVLDALDHHLPSPGTYHVAFQIDPSGGMKPKAVAKAQVNVTEWLRKTGAELHDECPDEPSRERKPHGHKGLRKATIEGVEIEFSRETGWWMPDKAKGRLFPARFAPQDYETLRAERLTKAMNKKLPKLAQWKKDGARSVLVLEDRDISLSNHIVILDVVEKALEGRPDRPDEVWLVDTMIEKQWTVWCLIRDDVSFPDEDTRNRYREFAPGGLDEV